MEGIKPESGVSPLHPLQPMKYIGYTEDGQWALFVNTQTGDEVSVPTRTGFDFIDKPTGTPASHE